jgi:hypothetical protein
VGGIDYYVKFKVNQPPNSLWMGVVDQTRAMLFQSAANAGGHANVEAPVTSA